jgi:hypothetical protein
LVLQNWVPGHVPASSIITVTIRNSDPSGVCGQTNPPGGVDRFDEKIDVFVGAYDDPDPIDVDTETLALILQLEGSMGTDPALEALAAKVFGRLIGETAAHEIVHGLLWDLISPSFHNSPPIPNDLMNAGVDRTFGQRTGMENTRQQSPVKPSDYVDHGLATIGRLQAANQALMDTHFPVPPALP